MNMKELSDNRRRVKSLMSQTLHVIMRMLDSHYEVTHFTEKYEFVYFTFAVNSNNTLYHVELNWDNRLNRITSFSIKLKEEGIEDTVETPVLPHSHIPLYPVSW